MAFLTSSRSLGSAKELETKNVPPKKVIRIKNEIFDSHFHAPAFDIFRILRKQTFCKILNALFITHCDQVIL